MKLNRRDTLILGAAAAAGSLVGLPSVAFAKEGDIIDQLKLMNVAIPDKVLGDPAAKVTMIEYASPTCPHCANWSNVVLTPFVEKYVKTGQVKFIIRPFSRLNLDAMIFMLAEHAARAVDASAPPVTTDPSAPSSEEAPADPAVAPGYSQAAVEMYDNVLSTFLRLQDQWAFVENPVPAIKQITEQLGFTDEAFNAARTDRALFDGIQAMTEQAVKEFGLEGTPTFYINGKLLSGSKSLEDLSAEIDPLLS